MSNNVNISNTTPNSVEISVDKNIITIIESGGNNQIVVGQSRTNVIEVRTPGAQGTKGDKGDSVDTGSFITTGSFNEFTASYNTGSFTGSFIGEFSGSGAELSNIPASAIVGLNLSQISSGSYSASISETGLIVNNTVIAPSFSGSLYGTASYAETALYAPGYLPLTGGTINGNIILNGTASIAFLNVTYESASIIYSTGSNQFGDAINDTQTLIGTVIISGSQRITGSLNAPSITGSLFGTASWAQNYKETDPIFVAKSGSLATTGSNTFNGTQTINGNLFMNGPFRLIYNNDSTTNMLFGQFDGSAIYGPYYQLFGNQYTNTSQRGSAEFVYDTRNGGDSGFNIVSFNGSSWTRKFRVSDSGAEINGSLEVTGGITGTLSGTASYANNADLIDGRDSTTFANTGSNTFNGNQVISGSLIVRENFTVLGSASVTYISESTLNIGTNLITVNTINPGSRFGGLAVIDSGSSPLVSASFLYDSVQDEFIFVHKGNGINITASHFMLGPETYDDLGNENYLTANRIPKGKGNEHLNDSNITDTGTIVSINSNTQITGSLSQGEGVVAVPYAHAEGRFTQAIGGYSHAEGIYASASGQYSHAEGLTTQAIGYGSHAEGENTIAMGGGSHAEGQFNIAIGGYSHAEGQYVSASGNFSHAEGQSTKALGIASHTEGVNTIAMGGGSHAEGQFNIAIGGYSHAEGQYVSASGNFSHAEGNGTKALGIASHTEGVGTIALGGGSHTEGQNTIASGSYSHAEGQSTIAIGGYSHTEGGGTIASGSYSHSEGANTISEGAYSHAEGFTTKAIGDGSHAEGGFTKAIGDGSHAEGAATQAIGGYSHAEGEYTKAIGGYSHAEGSNALALGRSSHAEGYGTWAGSYQKYAISGYSVSTGVITTLGDNLSYFPSGSKYTFGPSPTEYTVLGSNFDGTSTHITGSYINFGVDFIYSTNSPIGEYSHAEGLATHAEGNFSHAEGNITKAIGDYSHAEGDNTQAIGNYSHAEGQETIASGSYSHAEGYATQAIGDRSHAEGYQTQAIGLYSHAEGDNTQAIGIHSHAEGWNTIAYEGASHAEGEGTEAIAEGSHAEGGQTQAIGIYSHAEGQLTKAIGQGSHAAGSSTVALGDFQSTIGRFNISSSAASAFIIGNGTDDNNRSNLLFASNNQVQITGSLDVSGSITGSLFGTASFSTTSSFAISASWAPGGGNAFPYTGTAEITGSLFINTGSLNINVAQKLIDLEADIIAFAVAL